MQKYRDLRPLRLLALLNEPVKQNLAANLVGVGVGLDPVAGVGRTDHVVVEVEPDLISLLFAQLRGIVDGSDKAGSAIELVSIMQ